MEQCFQHSLFTSCFCVTLPEFSQYLKHIHHYFICYGGPCSVIFEHCQDYLGLCPKACPYKTANLIDRCACCNCCTDQLSPPLLSSPQDSLPPRHNNIVIRPINILTMVSKCSNDRKSYMSLTLSQR